MTEVFIFSLGIIIGCSISYIFFKTGIKSNLEAYDSFNISDVEASKNSSNSTDYDPETDMSVSDTSLDWNSYPYTNEYNDKDSQHQIIGYIDPDTDEKN